MYTKNKLQTLFPLLILLIFAACEKESTAPAIEISPELFSAEQQREMAQQLALSQDFINDMVVNSFSGAVAQPEFYGLQMAATETSCPAVSLSDDGEELTMQFGTGPTEGQSCDMLNFTRAGGTLKLNKNSAPNLQNTRACQPGNLEFDELYVQGCLIEAVRSSNGTVHQHPSFYVYDDCPNTENTGGENLTFKFKASKHWKMKLSDPNGEETVFNPIDSGTGPFMEVTVPNNFSEEMNFEDLYNASYQIKLPQVGSHEFNKVELKDFFGDGYDLHLLMMTTEDLVYQPYHCKSVVSGQVLLMDWFCTPLVSIDYGAGAEEDDHGECDNIVKICPADAYGNAVTDSPDCIVTNCLDF